MQPLSETTEKASSFLKGLASQHRLSILCALQQGELCVSEIQEKTGLAQTSLSQHLSKLKQEGIITYRRDHRTLYYCICNNLAQKIMELLYVAYCQTEKPSRKKPLCQRKG